MIGKKNIVFGFLFLVVTALLGPVMILSYYPDVGTAQAEKQITVGRLQALVANDYEEELEPLPAEAIAKANTEGILAINKLNNTQAPINAIKGGPHAHGNLEALLNIAVGVVLCFLAVPVKFKQLISWVFIAGTILHSGMLYLVVIWQLGFAMVIVDFGVGPVLILIGLLLAGVAAAKGFNGELVQD